MLEKIPYLNRSDSEPVDLIFNYINHNAHVWKPMDYI
jgi:hypothetical protein